MTSTAEFIRTSFSPPNLDSSIFLLPLGIITPDSTMSDFKYETDEEGNSVFPFTDAKVIIIFVVFSLWLEN